MRWSNISDLVLVIMLLALLFMFIIVLPYSIYQSGMKHDKEIKNYKYRIITKGDYYYANDYEEIGNCIIVNNVKNCGDYKIEIIN